MTVFVVWPSLYVMLLSRHLHRHSRGTARWRGYLRHCHGHMMTTKKTLKGGHPWSHCVVKTWCGILHETHHNRNQMEVCEQCWNFFLEHIWHWPCWVCILLRFGAGLVEPLIWVSTNPVVLSLFSLSLSLIFRPSSWLLCPSSAKSKHVRMTNGFKINGCPFWHNSSLFLRRDGLH